MTREDRIKLIRHLKYNRSIGADYMITDNDADEIIKALEQEPCKDAVSRESLKNAFKNTEDAEHCKWTLAGILDEIDNADSVPSVTPTRNKGKWIADGHFRTYHCSNCGNLQGHTSNFCEECGSENREVEDERRNKHGKRSICNI